MGDVEGLRTEGDLLCCLMLGSRWVFGCGKGSLTPKKQNRTESLQIRSMNYGLKNVLLNDVLTYRLVKG